MLWCKFCPQRESQGRYCPCSEVIQYLALTSCLLEMDIHSPAGLENEVHFFFHVSEQSTMINTSTLSQVFSQINKLKWQFKKCRNASPKTQNGQKLKIGISGISQDYSISPTSQVRNPQKVKAVPKVSPSAGWELLTPTKENLCAQHHYLQIPAWGDWEVCPELPCCSACLGDVTAVAHAWSHS